MHPDRLLVIDGSLAKRLAPELKKRGRNAVTAAELGVHRLTDPVLLRWLPERFDGKNWMLVTGDDAMPAEHGEQLRELEITLATIDGRWEPLTPELEQSGLGQEHWKHEIVHRWVHVMALQAPATIRRYSLDTYGRWTRRRKR